MAWKLLSVLSAVCLGAACYFAHANKQRAGHEKTRLEAAQVNLKAAQNRKTEGEAALQAKEELHVAQQKERDAAKEEVVKLATDAQEKEATLVVVKGNLEQVSRQVAEVQKQIDDAGDIEKLVAQIEKLKNDKTSAEGAVANQNQRLASVKESIAAVGGQINKLRETEAQGRRGIVAADFTARVAEYFPQWGFAILNKGNSQGVFANADLEIKRGRDVVAKLKVRSVEQHSAIADILPGSIPEGGFILTGDTVVAATTQSAAEERRSGAAQSAPAGQDEPVPGDAPAAPAMNSDPFGAPPAPAAPAMDSDPFGAPPAPAAPAMNTDPFGAPAAPAGGAMNSDPFGAPPAAN
jgi:hypothetical protein